ncbi:MAG: isoprenylcysteine carboxylmethyltransferase family protein [Thermodesulfobacteriota bacterium]
MTIANTAFVGVRTFERMKEKGICILERQRLAASRLFGFIVLIIVSVTSHSWEKSALVDSFVEFSGLALIAICMLGRLWASMYISGRKDGSLVTEGPYATVRHPLYFFSLIGGIGIGLSTENVLALGLIVVSFLTYYPVVIMAEEKRMIEIHKEKYLEYMKNTPRFVPRLSRLREPAHLSIQMKPFRRNFYRVMWFLWFFMILQAIEKLQHMGIMPVLLRIP